MRVALVAGESSGDTLGAAFIEALRQRVPQLECVGVAGPKMQAAGCVPWAQAEELAVMGLAEVLRHLPRLLRLRRLLVERIVAAKPDVFIGIDAPEFNLGLAKQLHRRGLRTVQYVSPQVWAWRQSRVRQIAANCDLVLCLLPFETEFYAAHQVRAEFVGHPLADQIPLQPDRVAARAALGIDASATLVAILPGSRLGEVARLGADFAATVAWLQRERPQWRFVAPMATPEVRKVFARVCDAQFAASCAGGTMGAAATVQLLDGQAQRALAAADLALVASGTATLEALLSKCPMVVAYRLAASTAFILRRLGMVKVPYFSQPNLLLGERRIPEFFQEQVTPAALGGALLREYEDAPRRIELLQRFIGVHQLLRRDGAARAAEAVLQLTNKRVAP